MLSANAKAVHPVNRPSSRTCLALPKLVNDRRNCAKKTKNAASDNLIYVALFWRDISGYTGYWQGLKIMERFNVLYYLRFNFANSGNSAQFSDYNHTLYLTLDIFIK